MVLRVRCSTVDVPLTLLLLLAATGSALAAEVHTQLAAHTPANPSANRSSPIPVDQLGAVAGKQYQGDCLSISATPEGARLRWVVQRLEGEATREGLWLTSTVTNAGSDRFRVVAAEVGRQLSSVRSDIGVAMIPDENPAPVGAASTTEPTIGLPDMPLLTELEAMWERADYKDGAPNGAKASYVSDARLFPRTGQVSVEGQLVRFTRPGLVEEYRVGLP